jgi:YARHG domain
VRGLTQFWKGWPSATLKPRAVVIAVCVGALAILFLFLAHLSRPSRPGVAKTAATPVRQNASPSVKRTSPLPLADGAIVQREELSPSGNIRVKYTWTKGNPVHRIVLENVNHPGESNVFVEYQRNAWILISPDDQWIVLNNRPSAGHSEVQLYQRQNTETLNYAASEETQGTDARLDQVVWKYYLQELQLPPDTLRDGVAIDAVGWDADSKKLAVTVTAAPTDADDSVPPPWRCMVDVASKEIDVTPEAIQAFNDQQAQMSGVTPSGGAFSGQQVPSASQTSSKPLEGDFSGERYPETRTRSLSADDISHWSLSNVRYAIEEIYARHGATFNDKPDVRKQFSKFAWYKPRADVSIEQIKSELSELERQNIETLEKSRDSRQAAGSKQRSSRTPEPGEKVKQFFKRVFSK